MMMNTILTNQSRKKFSSWILATFFIGLLLLTTFSEIFQTTPIHLNEDDFSNNPIDIKILSRLENIKLTNRLGTFELSRHNKTDWNLTSPRVMPAKPNTIQELIKGLSSLKIIKAHKNDALNTSNFSLDNPLITLVLKTELEEEITMKLGLINPIDNSAYIGLSGSDVIYQVEAPNVKFETLELGSFIDSRIFSLGFDDIIEFEIMRGKSTPWEKLTFSKGEWQSVRFKNITPIGTKNSLSKILAMNAHMIIDSKNDELEQIMENYLKNPLYTVKVKTGNKEVTYRISNLVTTLPEIKIEKKMYFLMDASDRNYPYLLHKDLLENFNISYKSLNENQIDKFFY